VKLAVAEPVLKPVPAPPPPPSPPPPPPPPVPAPLPTIAAPVVQAGPGFATLDSGSAKAVAGFDLGKSSPPAPAPAPSPAPAPPPTPAPPPPKPRAPSVYDVFADFTAPSREIEPQAGAVDVRRLRPTAEPAKDQAAKGKDKDAKAKDKDAKPVVPSHPSRIWVQIATGRDKSALGFDWRKLVREDPAVFKGQKPSVTAWGQANRLLAGPFATAKEANAFLAQLKKAGVNGAFVWSSPAGQVVDALAVGK
jgi:SPOR domain